MVHVHVRDREGRHSLDVDAYRAAIDAISGACGDRLVIQVTTELLGRYGSSEQMAVVRELRPEAASLALRELAPRPEDEPAFIEFLAFVARERIAPQIILYSADDARRLVSMELRGDLPFERAPVIFVLGRYRRGERSRPADLVPFLPFIEDRRWMVCAFGGAEAQCAIAAALLGGDVRVGFENNFLAPNGSIAPDNAALVRAVAGPLVSLGRKLATADNFRRSLALI